MTENTASTASAELERLLAWRDAELREELVPYVYTHPTLGRMLKHPLVFDVPLMLPGRANQVYEDKTEALAEAIKAENWDRAVFLHERPYRTDALVQYVVGEGVHLHETTEDIRALAASVWQDSENLRENVDEWVTMLSGNGLVLMDDEKGEWDALPETLTIYRGEQDKRGFCWSLSKETAEWFARRFTHRGGKYLTTATVAKSDVTGYLTGRGEAEILVIDRSKVTVLDRVKVEADR